MLFTGLINYLKSNLPITERINGPKSVKQYVDHYIAGLGRNNSHYQQFAANYAEEIENEFKQRLHISNK